MRGYARDGPGGVEEGEGTGTDDRRVPVLLLLFQQVSLAGIVHSLEVGMLKFRTSIQ